LKVISVDIGFMYEKYAYFNLFNFWFERHKQLFHVIMISGLHTVWLVRVFNTSRTIDFTAGKRK